MSFENPTGLRLGMNGTLSGKHYRVLGRVVMGMDDEGETYYWNEFNLANDQGESATLVYEQTEEGGEWRLFTMFESEYAITAEDAASKRVGDPLNLDGTQVRVTLVDESQVYHIEGQAPEGVEVGDLARYFNAEAGNTMQVVSWSGDEVECYRGVDLPHGAVARAFGSSVELPVVSKTYRPSLLSSGSPEGPGKGALRWIVIALIALLFLAVLFGGFLRNKHRATSTRIPAPATTLTIGQAGMLDGRKYRIQSRALIKCAQVARLYDWHEYALLDDESNGALLICGLNPGTQDYFLFRQVEPLVALTAEQAAAVRAGQSVNVNGIIAPVSDHFQSTVRRVEDSETNDRRNGDTFYGFIAQTGSIRLLVRWDAQGIKFYEGKSVPATEVSGAFNKRPRD